MTDEFDSEEEVSQVDEVAALLSEAAEVHSMVYRITDGEDADWATWYSKWLLELSELPEMLGEEVPQSNLTYELVRLDREYNENEPEEPWEIYYAERLIEEFGGVELEDEEAELEDDELEDEDEEEDDEILEIVFEEDDDNEFQRS